MKIKNIFSDIPVEIPDELTEILISSGDIRIERIISKGQHSPENFWYDQDQDEWVILLHGKARLKFYGQSEPVELDTGDYINIPPHRKHRVEWTDPEEVCVWLVVYYLEGGTERRGDGETGSKKSVSRKQ